MGLITVMNPYFQIINKAFSGAAAATLNINKMSGMRNAATTHTMMLNEVGEKT